MTQTVLPQDLRRLLEDNKEISEEDRKTLGKIISNAENGCYHDIHSPYLCPKTQLYMHLVGIKEAKEIAERVTKGFYDLEDGEAAFTVADFVNVCHYCGAESPASEESPPQGCSIDYKSCCFSCAKKKGIPNPKQDAEYITKPDGGFVLKH